MEVTQGILLPVLLAAIVANTVILMLVVVAARVSRRDRSTTVTRSALEGGMMSTSFIDRSGRSSWESSDRSAAEAGGSGEDDTPDADETHVSAAASESDPAEPDAAEPDTAEPDTAEPDAPASADSEPEATLGSTLPDATSGIDDLTGLLDQAAFTRLVIAEDVRIHRYHRAATVVIFELEGLDRLIDRLGADAADRIVPALADTMRRLARNVDHAARLAPGRFGVLLPETDEVTAINYVERVRRACELWLESGAIALRLAAGWAGTTGDPTLIEAQRLATDRMYLELRREARRAPDG